MQIIENSKVKEKVYIEKLDNGLTVMIIPKPGVQKKYMIWGTNYGSNDNEFIVPGEEEKTTVPNGVAHFLEHKMFEQENGVNSLDVLTALGTEANAYTTNDHTAYLFECTDNFYEAMKLANANGQSVEFKDALRKAVEVVMHFTYPNFFAKGSSSDSEEKLDQFVPMFNDSWNKTRSILTKNFKKYSEMFPESDELKYMATSGNGGASQGNTPGNEMKLFEDAGFYIMRNGWVPESTVMIFSNNKFNDESTSFASYSHNQPDNGTFELYINERNFFPDSGVCAYESSDKTIQGYRNWHRKTMHHNTLTLDDRNCEKADGKLLQSETKGNVETLVFENQSYPNMRHRRAVFYVNKEFFVLVDEGIGSAAGSANLSFNLCRYESEVEYDANEMGAHTTFTDNNIVVRTFTNETATFNEMEGRVAYVVKNDVFDKRKAYQIKINKLANKTARFITVIYPCKKTEGQTIEAVFTDNGYSANGASIKVTINGIEYPLSYILQSNNF